MSLWPLVINEALMNLQEGVRESNKNKSLVLIGCALKFNRLSITGGKIKSFHLLVLHLWKFINSCSVTALFWPGSQEKQAHSAGVKYIFNG